MIIVHVLYYSLLCGFVAGRHFPELFLFNDCTSNDLESDQRLRYRKEKILIQARERKFYGKIRLGDEGVELYTQADAEEACRRRNL
jgi:hypothetical protein